MNRKNRSASGLLIAAICLTVLLAALIVGVTLLHRSGFFDPTEPSTSGTTAPSTQSTAPTTQSTAPTTQPTTAPTEPTTEPTEPTTAPTEPPIEKVSTATISSVGDFLMHLPVINSAAITDGNYDFATVFTYFRDYVGAADYAVGNLETTLAGTEYPYKGYPQFNCPDGIVSSAQAAGFDMLLTANNHTYDTRATGFYRTQQIIRSFEMDYLGTLDSLEMPLWQIQDINGIRIGMLCYTYETDDDPDKKALNGIPMSSETAALIGTFSYGQLETFYEEMQQQIEAMENAGAEAIMLFIHWGNEYQIKQNSTQSTMAQKLCDLGVDVIVGGHPHVVQPIELLTSTTDESHKTVCIYSLGNILSNQRRENMDSCKTGHTEDGAMFSVTFAKYSDGTVILEWADVLPTWVDLYYNAETGKNVYAILPLDTEIEDWQAAFGLSDSRLANALASYDRTMTIVGDGLAQAQAYLAQLTAETEAALGITN